MTQPHGKGPLSQENWKLALRNERPWIAYEFPLFTDAWLTGEVPEGLGPYAFLNLVAARHRFGTARPAAILRVDMYLPADEVPDMSKTDHRQYHGGTFADEVAALASLVLGTRLQAGGANRLFHGANDPKGRPVAWDQRPEPLLRVGELGALIPGASGERSLNQLDQLSFFPAVSSDDAIAFVRCARLYQDAVWVAESEPNLSWLMLVSSVETAANQWRRTKGSAIDRLRAAKPELTRFLEACRLCDLVKRVAEEFADSLGSTKKFTEFLLEYRPPPPSERPPKGFQLSWESKDLEKAFRLVYGYRSKALHEGIPFPAPMYEPPVRIEKNAVPSEIPAGLASSMMGGVWRIEDTPMLLHLFEYIARGAVLRWWNSLAPSNIALEPAAREPTA